MGRHSRRKHQKMYNMKGCSKSRKHYLGGSSLAYTGEHIPTIPNPFLAYTGKGGSRININASDPTMPNTGPPIQANTTYNNASQQFGGCGQCSVPMTGGGCNDGQCSLGYMVGGVRHRKHCKCSDCKRNMKGGAMMKGGNAGIPYPNGLVGSPWTPNSSGWPGVNGVGGDRNYIANNTYQTDVSRQMVDLGANPPFLKGGRKGKRGGSRKQRGGSLSNFMAQDLINLGRQFNFGVGSAYNAIAGYGAPVNPMPWKDQLPSKLPLTQV